MIELLRRLLDLREQIWKVKDAAEGYGILDQMSQLKEMDRMQREMVALVEEWDKPDDTCWPAAWK